MAARVVRFVSRSESLRQEQAAELRQLVLKLEPEAPAAVTALLSVIDRHTAATKGWTFIMLSPEQNGLVVDWLSAHSARPILAMRLWAQLFRHLRMDTGEITVTRKQLAETMGCPPNVISAILSELRSCGALIRHQEGREVRWFMNPRVGTCLTGAARERAQAAAPVLRVVPAT